MMTFIMMTISFMVAISLTTVLGFIIFMQPKVMKWYMKFITNQMSKMEKVIEEVVDELES